MAGGTDAEWTQYVQSVNESHHRRERELDEQRRAHDKTLRSDVERELHSLKQAVKSAEAALSEARRFPRALRYGEISRSFLPSATDFDGTLRDSWR